MKTNLAPVGYHTPLVLTGASNGWASCLPSAQQAATKCLLSGHRAISLGTPSVAARRATCSATARQALVGISGVTERNCRISKPLLEHTAKFFGVRGALFSFICFLRNPLTIDYWFTHLSMFMHTLKENCNQKGKWLISMYQFIFKAVPV